MTKSELIGVNLTDAEKFDESVSEFVSKCKSLNVALSLSVYQSFLFDHNQLAEVLKLCTHLEEFQKKAKKWKFYGKSDQMDLDF